MWVLKEAVKFYIQIFRFLLKKILHLNFDGADEVDETELDEVVIIAYRHLQHQRNYCVVIY